jgi:hypothetical protein
MTEPILIIECPMNFSMEACNYIRQQAKQDIGGYQTFVIVGTSKEFKYTIINDLSKGNDKNVNQHTQVPKG